MLIESIIQLSAVERQRLDKCVFPGSVTYACNMETFQMGSPLMPDIC